MKARNQPAGPDLREGLLAVEDGVEVAGEVTGRREGARTGEVALEVALLALLAVNLSENKPIRIRWQIRGFQTAKQTGGS